MDCGRGDINEMKRKRNCRSLFSCSSIMNQHTRALSLSLSLNANPSKTFHNVNDTPSQNGNKWFPPILWLKMKSIAYLFGHVQQWLIFSFNAINNNRRDKKLVKQREQGEEEYKRLQKKKTKYNGRCEFTCGRGDVLFPFSCFCPMNRWELTALEHLKCTSDTHRETQATFATNCQ